MMVNEGVWDRVIRIVAGIVLGYAGWMTWPGSASLMSRPGVMSLVLLVIAVVAFVTGVVGWCPVYTLFDASTKKRIGA
ncbi:MAG: hypothetical protein A3H96_22375 [Acidobacteria bacterium RIFCSPLOWO2_02_FULL_67_36]|nr:MAG: hypothetical protein A3H96_22375 [Acidobacteria bacterium RIFCSPLOWO2_02_FULL_67_36]OFW22208.1 MAG: hypothetical protein A3G21_21855 [Acidobacteria bacterium RIFCSPLOWO2_12_FULL_66_21]